ncbi:NAD+-dependent secondary alcohol dehydrogenase Adh1 [Geodermatophilus ruber]|uniref:alcohol dehydrogenase n=1 Tax=Geodermatophilus ruber TaxID=504800 RepID=A0A1I4DZS3_9ACTN|nr:NAD+-dependent secondary alcohol dehydrogenase Adh1 [Geodermatophilus ruber]
MRHPLDVVVRIGGAGLCRTDLHIIEGQWSPITNIELPYTLGHENAGWVTEVGSAVSNVAVGDTVILHPTPTCGQCYACRSGDDMFCSASSFPGVNTDGGMAEMVLTSARACVRVDPTTRPADIAALADAGLTAYAAVKKATPLLHPGSYCVVIGAGGLGHIGIQCLTAMAATHVIVLDRNPQALELAKGLGARTCLEVVDDGTAVLKEVLEITDGRGADVVIDFVGEGGTEQYAPAMVRNGGTYLVVGYGAELRIPYIDLISRGLNVVGNLVGTYNELVELMALQRDGLVTLHTRSYPLDAVGDAIADLENGRIRGRGVLIPD